MILQKSFKYSLLFSIIVSLTLRESSSRLGNASCVTDVWSPYRITPINWLMVRRCPWRTHVVSLYRRTRHPLLRFLCLHEAAILPFGFAIFLAPKYYTLDTDSPFALRRLLTVELCSPRGEVPWNIAIVSRCVRALSRAMTSTVSVLSVWGFRMHEMRFMRFLNANFARISVSKPSALGLRCLKRSHPRFPLVSPRPGVRIRLFSPSLSRARACEFNRLNSCMNIFIFGMWHRFLRVRWYTANSSLRLRGFRACFSGWAPAWRPGGAAFSGLLWARGHAFARHWEACAGLARQAPRVSGFETRRAVP